MEVAPLKRIQRPADKVLDMSLDKRPAIALASIKPQEKKPAVILAPVEKKAPAIKPMEEKAVVK